jgi:hypothetical protein
MSNKNKPRRGWKTKRKMLNKRKIKIRKQETKVSMEVTLDGLLIFFEV